MCLIVFAYQIHRDYPFILLSNRDEFFDRPTKEWHQWSDDSGILAGQDEVAGGTWLGLNQKGRVAGLTNIRKGFIKESSEKSRGDLVRKALSTKDSISNFLEALEDQKQFYAPFNLMALDEEGLFYINSEEQGVKQLQPGLYGLCNGVLDEPWPKLERAKKILSNFLESSDFSEAKLHHLLCETDVFADSLLPNTGVSLEVERRLSPLFVEGEDYGTRSSTVILQNAKASEVYERSYSPGQQAYEDKKMTVEF